ncbi:MAG: rod shape-determining protein [Lachnospiraceae bacterium]
MQERAYGVDLGTSAIKIYLKGSQSIVEQKNMITMEGRDKIIAYGDRAYDMYEKTPKKIKVIQPVRNGVIADSVSMEEILNLMITEYDKKFNSFSMTRKEFMMAIPSNISEVEKKAFYDLAYNCGIKAKNIKMVEKSMAGAIGAGVDVLEPKGTMVVDLGADTTEISVLSLGGIVASTVLEIGGNKLDEAIMQYIRRENQLLCGRKTAEKIKIELGNAFESDDEAIMEVVGRDVMTGLPKKMSISSQDVHKAMKEQLSLIIDAIKFMLEQTPPELSADIINDGIYFIGGGSKLTNLNLLAQLETGLDINMMEEPEKAVVMGIGKIIEESKLKELVLPSEEMA